MIAHGQSSDIWRSFLGTQGSRDAGESLWQWEVGHLPHCSILEYYYPCHPLLLRGVCLTLWDPGAGKTFKKHWGSLGSISFRAFVMEKAGCPSFCLFESNFTALNLTMTTQHHHVLSPVPLPYHHKCSTQTFSLWSRIAPFLFVSGPSPGRPVSAEFWN